MVKDLGLHLMVIKHNKYPEPKKQTMPQIYLSTLTDWRTVFHLFNGLCSQWNHGISAAIHISLFASFISEYLNPGVKTSVCAQTLVLSIRLNRVHRSNILARRQTPAMAHQRFKQIQWALAFIKRAARPRGYVGLPADISANRSFRGWYLHKFAAGNFSLYSSHPHSDISTPSTVTSKLILGTEMF